jgi:multidrug efflux pump subunit AcrB
MLQLVKIALGRPLTFVVMAILIVLFGSIAWIKTPTDIFPDIKVPVIAAVWTYNGLSPKDMSGRIVYNYERQLTATVNDIEHMESSSYNGIGVVKIYFRPGVDIRTATAQVTSTSQTVLKQMPPGITPPLILNYSASTVPILQMALSSGVLSEQQLFDLGQNQIRLAGTVQGAAVPSPYGGRVRQIQIDLDPQALQAATCRPMMWVSPWPRRTRSFRGHRAHRSASRIQRAPEQCARSDRRAQQPADQDRRRRDRHHARRGQCA